MSRGNAQPDEFGDGEADAPVRLREDLGRLFAVGATVPPAVDESILTTARAGLARRWRHRLMVKWSAAVAAAAAVVLVSVRIGMHPVERGGIGTVATRVEDLNGDGRVDILDAFVLARRIKGGDALQKSWDVNGDGFVDQHDVDAIAQAAVKVDGAGVVQ
jgi:hypothetical protein